MKILKDGFIILLAISLLGTILFYSNRIDAQNELNEEISRSLELTQEGKELFEAGEHEEAVDVLEEALNLNNLNAETYVYLAYANLQLENYQEAYHNFISTLNMEATSVDIISNLTDILIRSGHYQEAEIIIEQGISDYPDDPHINLLLGKVSYLQADYEQAVEVLSELLKHPDHPLEANRYLGLSYYFLGEKEEAGAYYKTYLEENDAYEEEMDIEAMHDKIIALWSDQNG